MIPEDIRKRLSAESFKCNFSVYISFFNPFFKTMKEAEEFIYLCEHHDLVSKRAMHQLVRGISMADNVFKLDQSTKLDGIQVQYWIMTIETLYKATNQKAITDKYKIIRDFFSNYINSEDQNRLKTGIHAMDGQPLNIINIAL
ncbi:hypothetical protein CEF21_20125 [Bacillus sp. FJAT-42376]|uniref:hypothetical protein n=1 Tax=Bacillus sp. FJAT-42376 TaxID=2014076 RepID=UPI000F4E5B9E|nr:hypothetical protein [Bacillus sp. FJAT-42376]AZB44413.1 hypothetical protein CEF21_20125 [Bacillus sp. FJAT-42376]